MTGRAQNGGCHENGNDDANSGLVLRFGVRRRRGAGVYAERAAQQAEGIEAETDRRDSRKRARLLEGHLLKRVPVLTPGERAHREVLRMREGA